MCFLCRRDEPIELLGLDLEENEEVLKEKIIKLKDLFNVISDLQGDLCSYGKLIFNALKDIQYENSRKL
jgi:hypothetical protein